MEQIPHTTEHISSYLMFLLTMLNLGCWWKTEDYHGFDGIGNTRITTLDQCQRICVYNDSCVAIDWDPNNPHGSPCWTLTSIATEPTQDPGAVTHYELNPTCRDEC